MGFKLHLMKPKQTFVWFLILELKFTWKHSFTVDFLKGITNANKCSHQKSYVQETFQASLFPTVPISMQ